MRKMNRKEQAELLSLWADVPLDTPVIVRKDGGQEVATKTRSIAWMLPSGMAVIQLEGIAGCYSLDRVRRP